MITIRLPFRSEEMLSFPLPTRASTFSGVPLRECLLRGPRPEIPPGRWHLEGTLPSGDTLAAIGGMPDCIEVKLEPSWEDIHDAKKEVPTLVWGSTSWALPQSALWEPLSVELLRGNFLRGDLDKELVSLSMDDVRGLFLPASTGGLLLRIARPSGECLTLALPNFGGEGGCHVLLYERESGKMGAWVYPGDLLAAAIFGYMGRGLSGPGRLLLSGLPGFASPASCLAAAVYCLHCFTLWEAEAWLGLYRDLAGETADFLTCRAEAHARRGEHDESLLLLGRLLEAGLPALADGFSWAVDLLSFYLQVRRPGLLERDALEKGREVLSLLQTRHYRADFSSRCPTLVMRG